MAINYWAGSSQVSVPNNTTLTLWTLSELAAAMGGGRYLATCDAMVAFLDRVQKSSGEFPYAVGDAHPRPHFLCYRSDAFELLDLIHYYRLTGQKTVLPIMEKLGQLLSGGVTESGAARYNCHQETPEVPYYTAALAAALGQATMCWA